MRNVAILVPSYDGKVACNFSISIAEVFRIGASMPNMQFHLRYQMYEALIQKSRNTLLCEAYNQGMDDFIFIDADESFDPQALFDLLNHPVDVVGIPVPMKTDAERYNVRPEDVTKYTWDEDLNLLKVGALGTGFLRLSRAAVEAVLDASEPYNDGDYKRRNAFEIQIIDGGMVSEDIVFCNKLKAAGFDTYVDVSYTAKHFGTKCWTGDYKEYLFSQLCNKLEK